MNSEQLFNDKRQLANSQDILKDLLSGDEKAYSYLESMNLDMNAIKKAVAHLVNNPNISERDQLTLLNESWRVNYRCKPPTPEEFITEKYMGPAATHTYDRIKNTFVDFMNPSKPYRNLILYPHIGWGKDQPLDAKVYVSKDEYKLMKDIEVGDKVLSPDGSQTEVVGTINWSINDVYELELTDGRKMQCGPHHLHHVFYRYDEYDNKLWDTVETRFIIDNNDLKFTFEVFDAKNSTTDYVELKSITYIKTVPTKCISVSNPNGLYVTNDGIVTHNSYLTAITVLYITVCAAMMRDPWRYWNLNPATQLTNALCSFNKKKAKELLLAPFNNILESSPFFEKIKISDKMKEADEAFKNAESIDRIYYTTATKVEAAMQFSGGIHMVIASAPRDLLGLSLITCSWSELAFFTSEAHKSPEFVKQFYFDGRGRIESRLHNEYYGRSILDSSPNDINNPIDSYIVNDAPKDPTNYIVKGSMWEWEPEDYDFTRGTFKIYTGGKGNPPRILEPGDELLKSPNSLNIIEVPTYMASGVSHKQYFENDLVKTIKDRAGIPMGNAGSLINDYDKLEAMFDKNLRNIYTNITAPAEQSPNGLIWKQIAPMFFKKKANRYEYWYKPNVPRVVAVDQSIVNDMTAVAVGHVEKFKDSGDLIYVIDFTVPILATKDSKVNLEAIRSFICDLRSKGNMNIAAVGFDQFQSEVTIQNLTRDKFNVHKISSDKSTDPYENMASLINAGRIAVGLNIFLKNNIKSLHTTTTRNGKGDKVKIDHDNAKPGVVISENLTWETSPLGEFAKDVSDAVVGVIELCRKEFDTSEETWWKSPRDDKDTVDEKAEAKRRLMLQMKNRGFRV